jgi:hypothetical protein
MIILPRLLSQPVTLGVQYISHCQLDLGLGSIIMYSFEEVDVQWYL